MSFKADYSFFIILCLDVSFLSYFKLEFFRRLLVIIISKTKNTVRKPPNYSTKCNSQVSKTVYLKASKQYSISSPVCYINYWQELSFSFEIDLPFNCMTDFFSNQIYLREAEGQIDLWLVICWCMSGVWSNPIKGSCYFLKHETFPLFISTGWFQEWIPAWFT